MSKLDEAEQRLQRAVAGLEDAARVVASSAQSALESAAQSAADSSSAAAAPDPELAAELESAQARNASLEGANAAVAQRLDSTIARIKTILED